MAFVSADSEIVFGEGSSQCGIWKKRQRLSVSSIFYYTNKRALYERLSLIVGWLIDWFPGVFTRRVIPFFYSELTILHLPDVEASRSPGIENRPMIRLSKVFTFARGRTSFCHSARGRASTPKEEWSGAMRVTSRLFVSVLAMHRALILDLRDFSSLFYNIYSKAAVVPSNWTQNQYISFQNCPLSCRSAALISMCVMHAYTTAVTNSRLDEKVSVSQPPCAGFALHVFVRAKSCR